MARPEEHLVTNSFTVEDRFNQLKPQIDVKINAFINKGQKIDASESIFREFDTEFEKIKETYEKTEDKKNLSYVKFNYHTRKFFQWLNVIPIQATKHALASLEALIERNKAAPLSAFSLKTMQGHVKREFIFLSKQKVELDSELEKVVFRLIKEKETDEIGFTTTLTGYYIQHIEKEVKEAKIKFSTFKKVEEFEEKINQTIKTLQGKKTNEDKCDLSRSYELLYKMRKKALYSLIKSLAIIKKEHQETAHRIIVQLADNLTQPATLSAKTFSRFLSKIEITNEEKKLNCTYVLIGKEVDKFFAAYLQELWARKNVFGAWKKLDRLRNYLVDKVFNDKIEISEGQLKYFIEEWTLLEVFTKVLLLEIETSKNKQAMQHYWENEVFDSILKNLREIRELFKYEVAPSQDYQLKVITSQFSGGFSEFFVHQLTEEVFENGEVENLIVPEQHKKLLQTIKNAKSKETIYRNFYPDENRSQPDIDIFIENKAAIFVKNGWLSSADRKQICEEIKLCKKINTNKIFYLANFVKNMRQINELSKFFDRLKENYKDNEIIVFDIKDLLHSMLKSVEKNGKSHFNFPETDFYKILDY
jgi:hypothetical protein